MLQTLSHATHTSHTRLQKWKRELHESNLYILFEYSVKYLKTMSMTETYIFIRLSLHITGGEKQTYSISGGTIEH